MADPLVVIEWRCRGCGCLIQDTHEPTCRFAPHGVDRHGHRFVVPPARRLADMTREEIDAAVCWNYHLNEPLDARTSRLLRAALGLTDG